MNCGQDQLAVVGGVRGVVGSRAVVVRETDEPRVLDAVPLRRRDRKQHALGQTRVRVEPNLVVRFGQHQDLPGHARVFLVARVVLLAREADAGSKLFQSENVAQTVENLPGKLARKAELLELPREQPSFVGCTGDLRGLQTVASGRGER